LKSFHPAEGVSLHLEDPSEHYTTTTCATLISLFHMKLLDAETLSKFHDAIFKLRDSTTNPIVKTKFIEDAPAWDVSESACVWSTSFAVWVLLETGYKPSGEKGQEIRKALLWLSKRAR